MEVAEVGEDRERPRQVKRKRKRKKSRTAYIKVLVTEQVAGEIERIAYVEGYVDVSDYVRDLIRKDLKERGISIKMEQAEEAA